MTDSERQPTRGFPGPSLDAVADGLARWLGRPSVGLDRAAVAALLAPASVLVTGAGGTIGGELCRMIAHLGCRRLVLLDHAENPLFDIDNEIADLAPTQSRAALVADIRDEDRLHHALRPHAPDLVFHAAAHKHVPLMETNVAEAVSNNVGGTRNVLRAAVAGGATHVVLVSTDKAVRPTSVMGATKRIAELVVRCFARRHPGSFSSVRFGNVLGSQGSVLPEFMRQIARGGPVRVTHPEMRRYFVTVEESARLILQAATMEGGGAIFVLDMGQPVRILDLALEVIRLSGREVPVQFTGVRPGEKLYEEPFFDATHAEPTGRPGVLRARPTEVPDDAELLIDELVRAAQGGRADGELRGLIRRLVPDYAPEASPHNLAEPDRVTPVP